jgi:Kdo2-lipid IVA lauroyltransferase/acyltransferase
MGKKANLTITIEYAAARAFVVGFGLLPRRAAVFLAERFCVLVYYGFGRLRRIAMQNLEIAFPDLAIAERRKIARGSFRNLGRVLGELSQFEKMTADSLRDLIDFELDEATREIYAGTKEDGRGVLITTGHLGNWEMLVFGFAALYEPISYLARPLDNPRIEEMLVRLRTRFGNNPINKSNSTMLAVSILRKGGILGILTDVNVQPKEGVFVPFFRVPACTSGGAAVMAIRANAIIYPVFCVWDRMAKHYRFVHGSPVEPSRTGDRKMDIIETTAAYTAEIEKMIRQYPDQWMWIHKRWKTRPKGEEPIY